MQGNLATGSSTVSPTPNVLSLSPGRTAAVPTGGSEPNVYRPHDHHEYVTPQTAAVQADNDYALALQLQQAEEEAVRRYSPRRTVQPGATQSTLQGAISSTQNGGAPLGATPVHDGPRRFSGARHSGPVYVDPDRPYGGHSIGGRGRPGSGRKSQTSSEKCIIM
jgi:hypothetical protein